MVRSGKELLEDLHDLAVIARRKDEPVIPLAEVKRRLKRNGRRPVKFTKKCDS